MRNPLSPGFAVCLAATALASLSMGLSTCSGDNGSGPPGPGQDSGGGGGDATADSATDATPAGDASTHDAPGGGDGSNADASDGGRDYSTDPSKFYGNSRCAQAGVQLCEDFESGTLDKATWTVNGNAPVIDGVQHARGSKALHITLNGNGLSTIKETKTFPEPKNTYYGRIFVYFNQLPTSPGMPYAHWTFIAGSGTMVSGEIRVSGQLQNGVNHFGVGTDNRVDPMGTGDWTNSDNDPMGMAKPVPAKSWACIEWMHKGDTNETRFWWDAVEHPSLYTSSTMHGGNNFPYILPQFTNVWVGWQEYQPSTENFELWIDEIAIDKERIGCVL